METSDNLYISICRVCLKQSKVESMVSLKDKPGQRSLISYGKVLVRFAKISVEYDDIFPTKICRNCKQMIQNINSFKLMCKNNDRKLRKIVKLSKNDSEKFKNMIREYTLFNQYFPKEGSKKNPSSPASSNISKETGKIKSITEKSQSTCRKSEINQTLDYESDFDNSYNVLFDESQAETLDDTENIDLFLDSLENAVKIQIQDEHLVQNDLTLTPNGVDSFLNSIDRAVKSRIKYSSVKSKPKPPNKVLQIFHCDICNRTLANRPNYNYHMQRHTKYRYICDQCGRGFPGKVPLHRHLVKNHDKGPSLQCNTCPFKCSRRFDLVEHMRVHTGERPFTCEKCGLTFRRRAIWRNHLIQHQEKNISCNICSKKFHRQCELTWHINSAHERSFSYICSICNATYATNKTVRKHMISKHGIPREKQGKITRITKDVQHGDGS